MDEGNPNDLANPGQDKKVAEKQHEEACINLELDMLQSTPVFVHAKLTFADVVAPMLRLGVRSCAGR
jgi:hypothetical protein